MIHILYGADSFSRREAFLELRSSLDPDGSLATNTLRLSAREAKAEEVVAACAAMPFLGDRRLVILDGLLKLAQDSGKRSRKSAAATPAVAAWQPLLEFVPQMPETTVLLLIDGAASKDNPFLKALGPLAEVREFPPPNPKALDAWVIGRAKKIGVKLEPRAARLLAQMVGGQDDKRGTEYVDTWALAAELDKLATYANDEVIREQDVQALSPVLREQRSYLLCDAIVEKKPALAAKLLYELTSQREPGQVIISTIAGRFRRMAIARDMMDAGESGDAVRKELEMKPGYGFDKMLDQARRYSLTDARESYSRIVEADFTHKSGLGDEGVELETMVQDLAGWRSRSGAENS
jgi:DNA polymerase-3 subunit delta